MGGLLIVVAIIVIVCYIMWRKNQNKNTPSGKKSIESREKASAEKVHRDESLEKNKDSLKSSKTKDDFRINENFAMTFETKDNQKYDPSRKKDRGKKRREKRRTEVSEIKDTDAENLKGTKKAEPVEKVDAKKVEKVEPKIEDAKEKINEPVEKLEPKVEKVEPKLEDKKASEPVEKTKKETEKFEDKKVSKTVEKVEPKIEDAKEKINEPVKKVEAKVDSKDEIIKPIEKTEAKAEKYKDKKDSESVENLEAKAVENSEPKLEDKKVSEPLEKVEEKVDKAVKEKAKEEKILSPNDKYSDIIRALSKNPWDLAKEKINIKKEDLKTKKILEDDSYSLDEIKKSLTRENLSEFLNTVKTNPTVLKKKDKMIYEFTSKNPDEINKIKERYSFKDSNFEKATSVITVDKESFKLLEVTDILTEGEKRIYIETKF